MSSPLPTLVGRSSSHFTRLTRIFAHELGVACSFQVVTDLRGTDQTAYGEHPALRLPTLLAANGPWFGSLNICRELARGSDRGLRIVWPEQLHRALHANVQELTVQAMATEVELIMNDAPESLLALKRRESLLGTLRWLDANVDAALASMPERDLSYWEPALFCLVEHLEFRKVLSTEPFLRLREFASGFGERDGARATPFRFDP